jgi:hypothetical protein
MIRTWSALNRLHSFLLISSQSQFLKMLIFRWFCIFANFKSFGHNSGRKFTFHGFVIIHSGFITFETDSISCLWRHG